MLRHGLAVLCRISGTCPAIKSEVLSSHLHIVVFVTGDFNLLIVDFLWYAFYYFNRDWDLDDCSIRARLLVPIVCLWYG